MTIQQIIKKRGIEEILHFTTNKGITGILASGVVKSRKCLSRDQYLEYIIKYNCRNRSRDIYWHDYVNLSITSVNMRLFGISKGRWHSGEEGYWAILSFSPDILTHDGVHFATTNNAYADCQRAQGPEGLEALFANNVRSYGSIIRRGVSIPLKQPTCNQAEVLYPGELSLQYLNNIYVENVDHACAIESQFCIFPELPPLPRCIIKEELFV